MEGAIWVIVEHVGGSPKRVVREILGEGRRLADGLGKELWAVALGKDLQGLVDEFKGHPDRVLLVEDPLLEVYTSDGYVNALEALIGERAPSLIMAGATLTGRDYLPRLAARLGVAMVSEVVGITLPEDGEIEVKKPLHGGRALVDLRPKGKRPFIFSIRPRAFGLTEGGREPQVEVVRPELDPSSIRTQVVERKPKTGEGVELTEADVVVSGGRGMKGPKGFSMLEELAGLLGGAVGASRAVVDSGWRPNDEQVGKSGKTVSPDLYMAFGISGAIHHIMGMDTSRVVVAVNQDPNALIFQHADYGIVDDLFEVLPPLIEGLKGGKGSS